MQKHEHFEELCALVPIGQLTAAEYEELAEHLKTCANCCHATEDFALILDQLPVCETDVDEKTLASLQRESYRDRFLKRASEEGIPFSEELVHPRSHSRSWYKSGHRTSSFLRFAAAATVAVVLVVSYENLRQAPPNQLPVTAQGNQPTPIAPQKSELIAQLQASIEVLENRTETQRQVIASLQNRLRNSEINSANASAQLVDAKERLGELQARLEDADKSLAATRTELGSIRSAKDEEVAALVEQQFKLSELSDQLKNERAAAERERQLSQVVGDARDLMGARNLHIIDVSDVDGDGKAKKSFGRVFLTEGKSLIFYAFDLGNKGNAAKVSFQAWGQWEGQNRVAKNLGVFRIDDSAQRRWVVKVDNPEKLKNINTLFVTVEPLGGTMRPTGKRLLYAYFGLQPNHP
jgi:anti-sigma-K factor RskA